MLVLHIGERKISNGIADNITNELSKSPKESTDLLLFIAILKQLKYN
jgi:hypothetical protein